MQARPFVPTLWKNGLSVSMCPVVEKVFATPVGLANGSKAFRSLKNRSLSADATQTAAGARTSKAETRSQRPTVRPLPIRRVSFDMAPPVLAPPSDLSVEAGLVTHFG